MIAREKQHYQMDTKYTGNDWGAQMIVEKKHKIYGRTMSEWISLVPGELDVDAVGLWQIVPAGIDGFGLEGEELTEYVRRNLMALLEAGAIPVRGGKSTGYDWVAQHHYGKTKEEIIENIIREWLNMGNDPKILIGEVWFARPDPRFPKHVKMD
ncbi:MAG: hypothetical protein F9K51_07420 [Candidatus Dadabacteria bacterium]|nr:MAG: hypothetical protein F9K51_07420 [Candidatus Dadabacteria bacterium]